MTWTADEHRTVAAALLGSWPGTITAWGREAFAAYLGELEARGLSAEQALTAIRAWPEGSDFAPSAPNLAAAGRRDVSRPTFIEAYELIFGARGALSARPDERWFDTPAKQQHAYEDAIRNRAQSMHPLVGAFINSYGISRLRSLSLDDPDYGGIRRRELQADYEQFAEATANRELTALASGRRGEMAKLDPLAALRIPPLTELVKGPVS